MPDQKPGVVGPSATINKYRTAGEGRAKWASSPTPFRTLVALLREHVSDHVAKGLAAEYYHQVFGRWPGKQGGD